MIPGGIVTVQTPAELRAEAEAVLKEWGVPVNDWTLSAYLLGNEKGHERGVKDAEAISLHLIDALKERLASRKGRGA